MLSPWPHHQQHIYSLTGRRKNSMWGKFGQRTNKTLDWEFDDPQKFSTFCNSDTLQIKYVGIQSDDRVEVQNTLQEEDESISPNLNIFMACSTTCWACLKLYDALDMLKEQVLYKDMASVVFLSTKGMPDPPLRDYLEDFKDELPPDDYIVEFASRGPKNYGYKPSKVKRNVKSEVSCSIDRGRDTSISKSSRTTYWKTWLPHWSGTAHTIQNREERWRISTIHHGPTKEIQVGL